MSSLISYEIFQKRRLHFFRSRLFNLMLSRSLIPFEQLRFMRHNHVLSHALLLRHFQALFHKAFIAKLFLVLVPSFVSLSSSFANRAISSSKLIKPSSGKMSSAPKNNSRHRFITSWDICANFKNTWDREAFNI